MAEKKQDSSGLSILRPRARLLRTFGDELISSETVAVIELVKNSYDADAKKVWVRFYEPLTIGKGMIEVIDNGHGMSLETIQSAWMEPATLLRRRNRFSEKLGRKVLGEKGIGRFASSRLADSLEVITRRADMDDEIRVVFNWSDFDNEEKYLDEIEIVWERRKPKEICPGGTIQKLWQEIEKPDDNELRNGTILRMVGLKNEWDSEQFEKLRRNLSRLVSPYFGEEEEKTFKDFQIILKLPENFQEYSETIKAPEIIKRPHYVIKGDVDAEGHYELDINLKVKEIKEKKSGKFVVRNGDKPTCGPLKIEIRVWNRDKESLNPLATDKLSIDDIRKDLDAVSGITIYRDGFRVLPYGESQNDWLRLDARRVQNPTMRLSNNQIVGSVFITSKDNPILRDQSNREGIIEGTAFDDLQKLIVEILTILETIRRREKPKRKKMAERGLFTEFNLATIREYVRKTHPGDVELIKAVGDKEKDLENRVAEAEEVISRYRRLATLGMLIDIVLHDGRAPVAKIVNTSQIGIMETWKIISDTKTFAMEMREDFNTISNQSDVLATLFRKIEPFGGRRRGRPARISMESVIRNAFSVFEKEIAQVGATVNISPTYTEVTVDEAEVQEVIVNLLQNSLYWLRQVSKEKRFITVNTRRIAESEVEIIFSDSGPGVDEEIREMIFEPYFSTKPSGVGLGLTIAGEIVSDYYDGSLELMREGPLPGATFRILLCRRV
jgi:signal transduction histidine kinase